MNLNHGFIKANKFYDDVNFPRGFSRSGKFSITEAELLSQVGKRLWDLEQGFANAENQVEENFVSLCKTGREPETNIERLWLKYKIAIKKTPFHSLNGSSKVAKVETEDITDTGDEY